MLPALSGAEPGSEEGVAAHPAMTEERKPASLRDLDARLRQAREAADASAGRTTRRGGGGTGGLGFALRIGVELVAALIIGVAIGYFLDRWLGTTPWLMLLFFILGAVAGFMGVYRAAAGLGQTVGYRHDAQDKKSGEDGDAESR
jgi:ATP synthase protein I